MRERISGKVITTGVAYLVLLVACIAAVLLFVEEINGRLIASLGFIAVPFTAMFALFMMSMMDDDQNVMQNHAMTTLGTIYFVVTVIVTIIVNLLQFSTKWFVAVEILVLAFGATVILWGLRGKQHIEEQ